MKKKVIFKSYNERKIWQINPVTRIKKSKKEYNRKAYKCEDFS